MTNSLYAGERLDRDELVELYGSVGWTNYTRDPELLERAVAGSSRVVTARSNGALLGLARIISDGATIAYLQDVLVRPEARRRGIGRRLVDTAFEPYAQVRQHVLITDAEPWQRAFYESLGFTELHDLRPDQGRGFVRFLTLGS